MVAKCVLESKREAVPADPTKEVHWGEQTWEEMMMGYFSVIVNPAEAPVNSPRIRPAETALNNPSR